jgi:putative ABC transport system permease protein
MRPVGIRIGEKSFPYLSIRLQPGNAAEAMDRIQHVWQEVAPGVPLAATFLDDDLNELYAGERRLGGAISWFSGLAIAIACLGLLGLAAFTAERRTKEIGVRKVLGASVPGLIVLLTREFAMLVAIAFTIAAPIAWYALDTWLDNFAYRTNIGAGIFGIAAAAVLFVATVAVGYQSLRAALRNPVDSLRYE